MRHARPLHRRAVAAVLLAVLLLALVLSATGCKPKAKGVTPAPAPKTAVYPVTVTDDASRTVTVPARPERVVSLAPANTEIVAALGGLDRLVGVTTFCDYPPEVADLPKVGDFAQPNLEAIVGADPDVIFATSGVQADVISKLEQAGAVVIVVDPQTLDDLYLAIVNVSAVLGDSARGEALVAKMQADIDAIRTKAVGEPVPCFIEIAQDPLFTTGTGTLMDELITSAGGRNVVAQPGYVGYSLEQLLKDDPEVYMATKGSMSNPADIAKRAGYSSLSAVKSGRVVVLDDNLVSRPGPRVVDGIRLIAEALRPEAFAK